MLENGFRNFGLLHLESRVSLTIIRFEKCGAQIWKDLPIEIQIINIAIRNTAAKMGINVLNILGFAAINIARKIEAEIVCFNLGERHHTRILGNVCLLVECINNLMEVHLSK